MAEWRRSDVRVILAALLVAMVAACSTTSPVAISMSSPPAAPAPAGGGDKGPPGGGGNNGGRDKGPPGSPVLGVDLTEGADRPTLLTDAQRTIKKVCPKPNCVKLEVVVDRKLDDDEAQACEVRRISHPKPLRAGDRVKVTINRPCGEKFSPTTPK